MVSMEGHLDWIRELVPESDKTDEELKSYCVKLLEGSGRKDGGTRKGDSLNEWSTVSAEKLNAAALSIFVGDTKKAELALKELDELFGGILMKDATREQREVIEYFRDVLRWQNEGGVDKNEGMRLDRKWGILDKFGGKEVDAVIYYLRGSLGKKLGVRDDVVTYLYMTAWDLDSKCLAWYHHFYRILRQIRLDKKDKVPCNMEKNLVKAAYRLCDGKNKVASVDYALMLKEVFQKNNDQYWRDLHSAFVQVLENELRVAKGDNLMKMKIHLAELLCFGEGPWEDRMRGREMFSELERDYPKSFDVLYKVGNLYRMEGNRKQARDCYKRALELEPSMMPCIMDYVRLLKSDQDQAEIVRVVKEAMSPKYKTSGSDYAKLQRELELAVRRSSTAYFQEHWKLEYVNNY